MHNAQKLEKLEALRGAAAVYVVCHHTIPRDTELLGYKIGLMMSFGQEAVVTFFLLSGFVIAYSFAQSPNQTFARYFSRRFSRIYIPLVIVLLLTWLFKSIEAQRLVNPELLNLLGNLLMLQDLGAEYPGSLLLPYLGNGPLWSLSYEWWFYLAFFPLAAYVANTRLLHATAYGIACIAAIAYIFLPIFPLRVLTHFAIWWTGAYLAYLYIRGHHYKFIPLLLPILALAFITTLQAINVWWYYRTHGQLPGLLPHPVGEFRRFAFALFIVLAGLVWLRINAPLYRWLLKPFVCFAPISYGIYICHDPVMRDATYLEFINNPILEWLGYFLIVIGLSVLIELIIYQRIKHRVHAITEKLLTPKAPAHLPERNMSTGQHR